MANKTVVATARGYHRKLIEVGETFEVDEKAKGSWFEPVAKKDTLTLPKKDGKNGDNDLV